MDGQPMTIQGCDIEVSPAHRHIMVGVLGGMGPDATVAFMQRVIDATPAEDDIDHVHLLVDNNPKVPSRIKALIDGDGENPGPAIAAMARRLEKAGADFLVMPCNTAHYYWQDAQDAVGIPVWHIVERTLDIIARRIPRG
jgi:aspartate racemase